MVVKLAWVFAVVFLLIGVLGFVPGITADGHLLGIFEVDLLHNIIHLATGVLAALAAWKGVELSRRFFQVFGVVYALVTVVGFVQGDTVLGLVGVNMADNILHLAVAVVALAAGFFLKGDSMGGGPAPMAATPSNEGGNIGGGM